MLVREWHLRDLVTVGRGEVALAQPLSTGLFGDIYVRFVPVAFILDSLSVVSFNTQVLPNSYGDLSDFSGVSEPVLVSCQ